MGNGGYEVTHYTVTLDVDVDRNFVSGRAVIEANATQALSSFNLDMRGMEVLETLVTDRPAEHSRNGAELTIEPDEAIRNGASFIVEVVYEGQPTADEVPGIGLQMGWVKYPGGIYAVGEPWGSSTWFPVNEHPSDKAAYTFAVTVPKPYEVASIGELVSVVDEGATETYTWESGDELASYLAAVAIARFDEVVTEGPDGTPIVDLIEESVGEPVRRPLEATADMMGFFSRHLRRVSLRVLRLYCDLRSLPGTGDPDQAGVRSAHPLRGGRASGGARAGPPVVREPGDAGDVGGHLAERGVCHVLGVAVGGPQVGRRGVRRVLGRDVVGWPGPARETESR